MSEILLDFVDQLVGDDENVLDLFLGSNDRNNNNNDKNKNDPSPAESSTTTDMQAWLSSVNTNDDNTTTVTDEAAGGAQLSLPPVEDYCTMPTELFEANYTGQVESFQNTSVIHWMHTIPPRFGQTNNISALLLGTDQQQNDYVTGLVAAPLLVFFFFLVWGLVLMVFRYCAPTNSANAVRWLGGQPLRMPSPPMGGGGMEEDRDHKPQLQKTKKTTHYDPHEVAKNDDYQAWRHDYQRTKVQLFVLRIPVWFAGMAIAIAALIMSVYGVDSLHNTLETGRESLLITGTLAQEATKIVDSIIAQNQQLSDHLFDLLEQVNTLCPLVRDPLCDDVYNIATCDLSALGFGPDLTAIIHMAGTHFVEGNTSSIYQEIVKAKSALNEVVDLTIEVDQSAAQLNWVLSFSMVMSLLLAGICLVILLGLLCPEIPKVLQFLQSKIMIPLFVILVVFAYILSIVFVTGSIVTADVCVYTSPHDNIDERILSVLARTPIQDMLGPIVLEFLSFYIHQCPVDELPQDIVEQLSYIEAGIPLIGQFSNIVEESTNVIQGVCGFETNQTEALLDVAETIQVQLCSITDILGDIRNFMQCSNWYPLYETTVYETLCYDGTKGFAYVATTQFVIVFCSFLILTFRVAFWNIQVGDEYYDFIDDDDDDEDNKNENENSNTSENKNNSNKHNDEVAEYYKGMRGRVVPSSSTTGTTKTLSSRNKSQQQRVGPTTATAPVLATTTARHTQQQERHQQQRHEQQKQHSWHDRQGKIREMQQRRLKGGGGEHTTSNENTKRNNTTNSIAAAATSAVADSRGSSSTAAILHDLNLSSSLLSNDDTAGTAMMSVPTNESFENINTCSKTEPSFPSTSWFTTMITTNDDDDDNDDNALQNNNNNSHYSSAFAADRFASSFENSQLNVSYDDRNDDNEDPAPPLDWFGGGAMSAIFSFFNNDDTPEENTTEIRRNSQYPSRRLQRNGTRSTNNNLHRTYHHHEQDEKDDIAYPNIEIEPNFNKSMMTKPTAAVDAWSMWANQPQYSDDTDDRSKGEI